MKKTFAGVLIGITASFGTQAEAAPTIVDSDAKTISWAAQTNTKDIWEGTTLQILNCRFGTLTVRSKDSRSGAAVVDLASSGNQKRTESARQTCKERGLTPEF